MANPFMPANQQNPMQQFEQQFNQFKQSFPAAFNPRSEVEKALKSGSISQNKLNAAIQQARMMGFQI